MLPVLYVNLFIRNNGVIVLINEETVTTITFKTTIIVVTTISNTCQMKIQLSITENYNIIKKENNLDLNHIHYLQLVTLLINRCLFIDASYKTEWNKPLFLQV